MSQYLTRIKNGMPVKTNIPFLVAEPGIEPEFKV